MGILQLAGGEAISINPSACNLSQSCSSCTGVDDVCWTLLITVTISGGPCAASGSFNSLFGSYYPPACGWSLDGYEPLGGAPICVEEYSIQCQDPFWQVYIGFGNPGGGGCLPNGYSFWYNAAPIPSSDCPPVGTFAMKHTGGDDLGGTVTVTIAIAG